MIPAATTLLLRTTSSDENYHGDLDLGVVGLTPVLAKLVLERHRHIIAFHQVDRQLHSACWFDYSCSFVAADLERLEELRPEGYFPLDEHGWSTLTGDLEELGLEPQRTEGEVMHVDERHVWWSSRPKHTDVTVETTQVPISFFVAFAAQDADAVLAPVT